MRRVESRLCQDCIHCRPRWTIENRAMLPLAATADYGAAQCAIGGYCCHERGNGSCGPFGVMFEPLPTDPPILAEEVCPTTYRWDIALIAGTCGLFMGLAIGLAVGL